MIIGQGDVDGGMVVGKAVPGASTHSQISHPSTFFRPKGPQKCEQVTGGQGGVVVVGVVGMVVGASMHSHVSHPFTFFRPEGPQKCEQVTGGQGGMVVVASTHSHVSHPLITLHPDELHALEQVIGGHGGIVVAGVVGMTVAGCSINSAGTNEENKNVRIQHILELFYHCTKLLTDLNPSNPPRGHSTFFQVGVCCPDFRSVGLVN